MSEITCPKGHTWNYRGKAVPGQYVCCPTCSTRFRRPFPENVEVIKADVCVAPCQYCGAVEPLSVVKIGEEALLLCERCATPSQMRKDL